MKKKVNKEALKAAEIVEALGSVTKDKSIGMDLVLETIKDALTTAAKKYLGTPLDVVDVKVDREKGTIEVYKCQMVVEAVEDPEYQITLEEARTRMEDEEINVGDKVVVDTLEIDAFGRMAVQTAKQVIVQRVREAERDRIFSDYSERIGEIVTGKVQQVERGVILVDIGRTEAILPLREQIRKERYSQGMNIRACIKEVKSNTKGPQVIISRTCEDFLERLFESEVPEISDKTVKIVKVVRDPGHRSKIAVTTSDSRVDPVGACVGMRGNRVQNIVRELSNERIDIINWTDELSLLVRRVFAPAEVKRVIPVGDHKIVVVIAEDGLALAIGREGQNIRLASKMLAREIDVFGDEEFSSLSDEQRAVALADKPDTVPVDGPQEAAEPASSADAVIVHDEEGDDTIEAGVTVALTAIRQEVESEAENEVIDSVHEEIISDAVVSLSETDEDSETAIENANKSEV
ncbi:MAG: transcription termination factor NusA [Chitinispirillia bacterium]|nr:transcription termination factor NusA [Chitinispirillia bacterium]